MASLPWGAQVGALTAPWHATVYHGTVYIGTAMTRHENVHPPDIVKLPPDLAILNTLSNVASPCPIIVRAFQGKPTRREQRFGSMEAVEPNTTVYSTW